MKKISVWGGKGGTGKTTFSLSLAQILPELTLKTVSLCDLDPQDSANDLYNLLTENGTQLAFSLYDAQKESDIIVIDHPPSDYTTAYSDINVIIMRASMPDLLSLQKTLSAPQNQTLNPETTFLVFNQYPKSTTLKELAKQAQDIFPFKDVIKIPYFESASTITVNGLLPTQIPTDNFIKNQYKSVNAAFINSCISIAYQSDLIHDYKLEHFYNIYQQNQNMLEL